MNGNTTMLIWLGKQRCDQKERTEREIIHYTDEQKDQLKALFAIISNAQDSSQRKLDNNNSSNV